MSSSLKGKISWLLTPLVLLASSAAFADGGYVAIVFNPSSGAWGSHHGSSSRLKAESDALAACPDCAGADAGAVEDGSSNIQEVWAYNGWVAYAYSKTSKAWGVSGVHDSQADAEQSALANCGGYAAGCHVVRSLASFANGPDADGTHPAPAPAPAN